MEKSKRIKEPQLGMYGLPVEVKFCKKCVVSNQRPNSTIEFKNKPGDKKTTIFFDKDGVCDACNYALRKKSINWQQREKQMWDTLKRFRSKDGRPDVIVPGSGGKDSIKAAHILKYKYKMNPIVVTWAPHLYTYMGKRNMDAWTNAGFDSLVYTPNQKVHRLITRLGFERLCHPFQPFIIGQKNLAPKMSLALQIPLVMFGENEAEYGNAIVDNEKPTRDHSYYASDERYENLYLGGVSARELLKDYGVSRADLEPYLPADPYLLQKIGTEVHYLGYYEPWDQHESYYYSVEHTDFLPNDERTEGSYCKYASFDDKIDWFHWYTYFVKFGMGRATDDATHEIRDGHITREEGVRLVRRFDGEFPALYFRDNLDYMGISEDTFYRVIEKARPPHLWKKTGGDWKLKHQAE